MDKIDLGGVAIVVICLLGLIAFVLSAKKFVKVGKKIDLVLLLSGIALLIVLLIAAFLLKSLPGWDEMSAYSIVMLFGMYAFFCFVPFAFAYIVSRKDKSKVKIDTIECKIAHADSEG